MERRQQPVGLDRRENALAPKAVAAGAFVLCSFFCACQTHSTMPSASCVANPREAAESAMQAGNWGLAAERWYAVFLQDRDAVEPCAMTARALLHTKDADSASHVIDLGLENHPDNAELCELKADALVQLGFRRAAEEYYLRALEKEPKRASALLSLASMRMDLGWETAALGPLEQAIAITGGDPASWYMLAQARRAAGNPCGAFEAYAKAFARNQGSVDQLVAASTLTINDTLRRAHPDAPEVMQSWLARVVSREPQCTKAHFMLGVLSEELGNKDQAITQYRRAIETDPACLMSLRNLAVLYASMGDEKNTRDIVSKALALEKDHERRKALQRLLDPFENKTAAEHKVSQTP
jgi:predicted Zn-dependent protease